MVSARDASETAEARWAWIQRKDPVTAAAAEQLTAGLRRSRTNLNPEVSAVLNISATAKVLGVEGDTNLSLSKMYEWESALASATPALSSRPVGVDLRRVLLHVPVEERERYAEEWAADAVENERRPVARLLWRIGLYYSAWQISSDSRRAAVVRKA